MYNINKATRLRDNKPTRQLVIQQGISYKLKVKSLAFRGC